MITVLGAVDDVQVAVGVQEADVAGAVPAVAGGLARRLGVAVVTGHHQRAADHDLAALAVGEVVAVVGGDRQLDERGGATRGREALAGEGAVGVEVLGRGQGRDHHRRLGLAVELAQHRADARDGLLEARGDIGAAPYHRHCSDERSVRGRSSCSSSR